jgi:hypothetical protein
MKIELTDIGRKKSAVLVQTKIQSRIDEWASGPPLSCGLICLKNIRS